MNAPLPPSEAAALYWTYGYFLLRRCRAILRDDAAAEDALQHAFENILRSGSAVRTADEPLRWLYRVVDRCCFDALRRRVHRRESPEQADARVDPGVPPGLDIEMRDAALHWLSTMNEEEMQLTVLLFVDGMSQAEIATEMGLSRVTVNKRVQRLRARAELAIAGRGGEDAWT